MSMKRVFRKFDISKAILWSGHILSTILYLLQVVAITRIAGSETMGVYIAVVTITGILVRLMDVGLPSAILYFIRMNENSARAVAKSAVLHLILMAPWAFAGAYMLRYFPFESGVISDGVVEGLAAIMIGMIFQLGTALSANIALALKMYVSFAAANCLPPLIMCALLLGAYVSGRYVSAADLFEMTALSFVAPFAWLSTALLLKILRQMGPAENDRKSLYQYGMKTVPGVAAKVVGQRFDRLLLSTALSAGSLSHYAVATTIRDGLLLPFNAYSLSFMNDLMDVQKKGQSMYLTTKCASLVWFVSMAILAGVAAVFMPTLIPAIFGSEFQSSAVIAQIVVFSGGFQCVSALYWTYFLAEGRPLVTSWLAVWSALILAPALLIMVPRWGTVGAGAAIVLSAAISAGTCVVVGELLQRTMQKRVAAS
jgi:O-antigen/teichoic acid export membrane protein